MRLTLTFLIVMLSSASNAFAKKAQEKKSTPNTNFGYVSGQKLLVPFDRSQLGNYLLVPERTKTTAIAAPLVQIKTVEADGVKTLQMSTPNAESTPEEQTQ